MTSSAVHIIMVRGAKADCGSRRGACHGSGDVGLKKKPAGAKKTPSASRCSASTAQGARNGEQRAAEQEVVRLLDEGRNLRMTMLRLLEQVRTAMLALFDVPV